MNMNMVLDLVMTYWYVLGIPVIVSTSFLLKHMAKSKAKDIIMKYFDMAEKMVFDNADAKLAYVSTAAYGVLPKSVKMFVSPALFSLLVTQVYDSVKEVVQANQDAQQEVPAQAAPAQPEKK